MIEMKEHTGTAPAWCLKNLIPPQVPDLRTVNLSEVEVSVAALNAQLRTRVQYDQLPRQLQYQLCLSDDSLTAARYFIQGRTGLPASSLDSTSKLRLRESISLAGDGTPISIFELTVKSAKASYEGKKRVECSEISVRIHEGEFNEWERKHEVTGRLSKLRLFHACGDAQPLNCAVTAEIDHIIAAGRTVGRPSIHLLSVAQIPSSPLAFNLIDFELRAVQETLAVDITTAPFDFLNGIGIDLSSGDAPKWTRQFRKGTLAREGITNDTRRAERKLLLALAA